jgi:hypothetical protein
VDYTQKEILNGELLGYAMNVILGEKSTRDSFVSNPDNWIKEHPEDGEIFKLLKKNGALIISNSGQLDHIVVIFICNSDDKIQIWKNGKVNLYMKN